MGYTHYWAQPREISQQDWDETIRPDIEAILKAAHELHGVKLGGPGGEPRTKPQITDQKIWFNGISTKAKDDSHETMCIDRVPENANFTFCKTARKPYDIVVTACLCYLSSISQTHDVTSDGHGDDFVAGLVLARMALPKYTNQLDIPFGVMKSDRWCCPWVHNKSEKYEAYFCVDGCGYVLKHSTGDSYCFSTHLELAKWLKFNERTVFARGGKTGWGDYGKVEPNIWNATGSFDKARHERIGRAQEQALASLFPAPASNAIQPPEFVRPHEFQPRPAFVYSFEELLKAAKEAAA